MSIKWVLCFGHCQYLSALGAGLIQMVFYVAPTLSFVDGGMVLGNHVSHKVALIITPFYEHSLVNRSKG